MANETENSRYRPVVVAIGGGSATGKSTLARALAAVLEDLQPVILDQDSFFRDFAEYTAEERERVRTANHPNAVHWPAFHAALDALLAGETTALPVPGTRLQARGGPSRTLGPTRLILIEGLFALWDERCRTIADLRLYTEIDDEERVLRRLSRDTRERGANLEHAIAWYRRDVKPNFPVYTKASRQYADLVVVTDHATDVAVRVLGEAIRGLANTKER